ncbi:MAG: hypothetical protein AAGD17_05410 [Bacteroidota bacterium]
MEFEKFDEIRQKLCLQYLKVTEGKMMSSPAIHFNKKVFAFFSRDNKMVFKLGTNLPSISGVELVEFNPFRNKGLLTGWYETDYIHHATWKELTEMALHLAMKKT